MPRKVSDLPTDLRPYRFHGVDFDWNGKDEDVIAECPFCGREKFSINSKTSKFQCWGCKAKGNSSEFIKQLWDFSDKETDDYSDLAQERGIRETTLMEWGAARCTTNGSWIMPGYNAKKEMTQLYKWAKLADGTKLLATPSFKGRFPLFGVNLYNKGCDIVYLCEGPWDAMRLWETLGTTRFTDSGEFVLTANRKESLLSTSCVLAVPGCNIFQEKWMPLFSGKVVVLCYDNDHPKKNPKTGKREEPAALLGLKKAGSIMLTHKNPPDELNLLKWGAEGYNLELPSGADVRDIINAEITV